MGGLAGHMDHIIDNEYLTGYNLKEIVREALVGNLKDVREKFDGFNIFASKNKEGQIVFARNNGDIINGGMSIMDIREEWKNKPEVLNKYIPGLKIIIDILNKSFYNFQTSEKQYYLNCECIIKGITNIIQYDKDMVVFHCLYEYSNEGKLRNILDIPSFLKFELTTDKSSTGNYLTFNKRGDINYLINYINRIFEDDNDTIEEHCYRRFKQYIYKFKLSEDQSKKLFQRYFIKYPLKDLRKIISNEVIEYCESHKKEIKEYMYRLLKQFQLRFEDEVINCYTGYINKTFPSYILNKIPTPMPVPLKNTEGIVCRYDRIEFKCTGGFAIVNQLLHERY